MQRFVRSGAKILAKFRFEAKIMHTLQRLLPVLINFRLNTVSFVSRIFNNSKWG